jgi:ABC-type bacteriocin/lantibiotic exporter with double-glycine peptidase domain
MTAPTAGNIAHNTVNADRTAAGSAFDLRGVCFSYRKKDVLNDISLNIARGESLGIVGQSGSGKTTLLLLLLRLLSPRRGEIAFYGNTLALMKRRDIR